LIEVALTSISTALPGTVYRFRSRSWDPHTRIDHPQPARERTLAWKDTRNMHSFETGALFIARSTWRVLVPVFLVFLFTSVAFAQDHSGPPPENAHNRSFGGGWDCDDGYRQEDGACIAVVVPEDAFATERTYGKGWECRHGFKEADGATCREVVVPPNAYLTSTGEDWACDRGYRRIRNRCEVIESPENSFLSDDTYGSGWECDRGFSEEAGGCVTINVPENAYLTNKRYGPPWACDRGFVEKDGRCEPIVVPDNAFLVVGEYGPGWRCERGYEQNGTKCTLIVLPENAHIDRSGNRWDCNRGFRMLGGQCVLAR